MADDVLTYLYSTNKLTNGGAEAGDLTGWDSNGVTVVDGGTVMPPATTGLKAFYFVVNPTYAMMWQEKSGPVVSPQPPDYKLIFDYLPETEQDVKDPKVYAKMEAYYNYGDGDFDLFSIPCRKAIKPIEGAS